MLGRAVALALVLCALAAAPASGYRIPPDNPFAGQAGARPEIYSYGLRNPFRFSFDRTTGDLTIGDVGQDTREEIDYTPAGQARGANFGWDCWEGTVAGPGPCPTMPAQTAPVYDYSQPSPRAVTGGVVVRDGTVTQLDGKYVFADFYTGDIESTQLSPGSATPPQNTGGLHVDHPVAFGQDTAGHVYVVSYDGSIYRLAAGPALVPLSGSFSAPMFVAQPPGDSSRLFVVEQSGRVQLLVNGVQQPTPFLDISSSVSTDGERGLSTIAFAPDYASSGRFFVYYTDLGGDIHVAELHRSSGNPNVADRTETTVLTIEHSLESNHYGGQLYFGPDDDLYISTGDGGGADDPAGHAQSLGTLLGKLLRIDVSAPSTPSGPGPGAGGKDTRAPSVSVRARRHQRILEQRAVILSARPDELSSLVVSGRVRVGNASRSLRLKSLRRGTVAAGQRARVKLRASKRTLGILRRGLRQRRSLLARVTVTARDRSGNARTVRRAIRLVR